MLRKVGLNTISVVDVVIVCLLSLSDVVAHKTHHISNRESSTANGLAEEFTTLLFDGPVTRILCPQRYARSIFAMMVYVLPVPVDLARKEAAYPRLKYPCSSV